MLKNDVGKRLKEARKSAGYTQKQVAEKMGTVQSAYIKYELGKLELDYEKMVFLCRLFDTSSDYLLGIADESGRRNTIVNSFNSFNKNSGNINFHG